MQQLPSVDGCKRILRMWSVQFAAFAAAVLATLAANPQPAIDFLNTIPPEYAWLKPVAVFLVTFGAPTLLRAMRQPGLEKPVEGGEG